MIRSLTVGLLLTLAAPLVVAQGADVGFEIKGLAPGVDISAIDTSACRAVKDADSGVPGLSCDTTLAGEKAELRLPVHEKKVVALIFRVDNALMTPTLDALTQKYGRPVQPNRYIEAFNWTRGDISMAISKRRVENGYTLVLVDLALFRIARAASADKAKKDL